MRVSLPIPAAAALAAALPLVLATSPARASADIGCTPDVRLAQASFSRCDVMAVLGPGNDTRANLLLLLQDRDGVPPPVPTPLPADSVPLLFWTDFRDRLAGSQAASPAGYADGEGSRCLSNETGTAAFAAALTAAADVPTDERTALIQARKDLAPTCGETGKGQPVLHLPDEPHSAKGQAFAIYLRGIEAFYAGGFDTAAADFAKLHGSADAWLADTSDYMAARTQVNALQVNGFDDYGDHPSPKPADQAAADRAAAGLDAYLHDHAGGRYVGSARGLQRRVAWLADRKDVLAASYVAAIARPPAQRGVDDGALAEEIGDKMLPFLKPAATHDPILLATLDLAALRAPDDPKEDAAPPRVDLEAQRADFAAAMPLFDFLVATQAFYVDHDLAKVTTLLPDDTRRRDGDHLWFARQVLRGLALEAKGDRNARGFWKELFAATSRPLDQLTVELALAMHDERAHTLDDVFAKGSIVTSPRIRRVLLENSADATLLRRQARDAAAPERERQIALVTLLWKEFTRGHYADFVEDVGLVPKDAPTEDSRDKGPPNGLFAQGATRSDATNDDFACPKPPATARQLADDPRNVRARLCLAEFARQNYVSYDFAGDDYAPFSGTRPTAADLGGAPSMFPGKPYDRASTYKAIIADKGAPAVERAYALYRAVMCWAPSSVNECGGPDVPKAQRAAWFKTLKRDYPNSKWAEELTYWW